MPLIATRGAASAQGFGEFAQTTAPVYIEDVFSTWLYAGNGSTQTITNGIDLAGKGGLVWVKGRSGSFGTGYHLLQDSSRGFGNSTALSSNATDAQYSSTGIIQSVSSTGFTSGASGLSNASSTDYASWTFRKAEKFFDVVTYTGNGGTLSVSHSLASKPGCIIIKRTDNTGDWLVCTRKSDGNIYAMYLNTTAGQFYDGTEGSLWTSTAVSINWINSNVAAGYNNSGATYVMYVFAHDAGGFGDSGSDNVISCGSFTTDGSGNATVTLGYEPQWMMLKTTGSGGWFIRDTMRGFVCDTSGTSVLLTANTSNAESSGTGNAVTATGTQHVLAASTTYIYIAIRRGPMKTPTTGTSVFSPNTSAGATGTSITTNFPVDLQVVHYRPGVDNVYWEDRLRGVNSPGLSNSTPYLLSDNTNAEASTTTASNSWDNLGFKVPGLFGGASYIYWNFRRAPGFFDVVCYTGTGANRTVTHNLGVVPELMILKSRTASAAFPWTVYVSSIGTDGYVILNLSDAKITGVGSLLWNSTAPTSLVFSLGTANQININTDNFVAYLFASLSGVSKVGSYTGTGTTLQVNCGFTNGSRFVLIKRTDSTGDWYVWDSARGIVAGNDPYLLLNSTAAEVTNTDYVDTYSAGFEISSTAPAAINANGGTFIFLAIA